MKLKILTIIDFEENRERLKFLINEMKSNGDDKYLSRLEDEAYIEHKRKCNFREPNQPHDL